MGVNIGKVFNPALTSAATKPLADREGLFQSSPKSDAFGAFLCLEVQKTTSLPCKTSDRHSPLDRNRFSIPAASGNVIFSILLKNLGGVRTQLRDRLCTAMSSIIFPKTLGVTRAKDQCIVISIIRTIGIGNEKIIRPVYFLTKGDSKAPHAGFKGASSPDVNA